MIFFSSQHEGDVSNTSGQVVHWFADIFEVIRDQTKRLIMGATSGLEKLGQPKEGFYVGFLRDETKENSLGGKPGSYSRDIGINTS